MVRELLGKILLGNFVQPTLTGARNEVVRPLLALVHHLVVLTLVLLKAFNAHRRQGVIDKFRALCVCEAFRPNDVPGLVTGRNTALVGANRNHLFYHVAFSIRHGFDKAGRCPRGLVHPERLGELRHFLFAKVVRFDGGL